MRRFLVPSACLALGAVAWLAASARAADLDKYLPDDAQSVTVVNVKAITSWAPFQKLIQPKLEDAIKTGPGQMSEMIKETGIDPFRDIERVVVAAGGDSYKIIKPPQTTGPKPPPPPGLKPPPGAAVPPTAVPPPAGPQPPGGGAVVIDQPPTAMMSQNSPIGFPSIVLIQGKFDADKLRAAAEKQLKDHPETMKKPRTIGNIDLWEATQGNGDHVYMAAFWTRAR